MVLGPDKRPGLCESLQVMADAALAQTLAYDGDTESEMAARMYWAARHEALCDALDEVMAHEVEGLIAERQGWMP